MYDYLIVGSGFYGAICAYELNKRGYKCLVIDKRSHIAGNCYTEKIENINVHKYGPHIFHTSNRKTWEWINKFAHFNNFIYAPIANYKNEIYSLPFNMLTFNKMWGVITPDEAKAIIEKQGCYISVPQNFEEHAIKTVGKDVYEKLIKGYTTKQWKKEPMFLPSSIIKRIPVRFTYNNNYFNDIYQGIPIEGYTKIFEKLLDGIEIKLDCDYFDENFQNCKNVIYTGPIDKFFNYEYGELEYKTVEFKTQVLDTDNYQGIAVINYTDVNVEYTRIIEHKHFENSNSDKTVITKEYPIEYNSRFNEPMYPVNDIINTEKYEKYKKLSKNNKNIIFGGRLAEYKYYDMDKIIESALNLINKIA